MKTTLVVGGARGIGRAWTEQLLARGERVIVTTRHPSPGGPVPTVALDLESEQSIAAGVAEVRSLTSELDAVVCVAGLLHDGDLQPEKRLEHLDAASLQRVFAVNALGPMLLARHCFPLLNHGRRAVFASFSARVGSIGDNRLGGWYAYRSSKAAQNMFTKTFAIEASRRAKQLIVLGLHPGTVETDLSAPFRSNVPAEKLFSTDRAARQLIEVVDGVTVEDSGTVFAWDGQPIPW